MKGNYNKCIKVLHIIDNFGTGGAETWLLEIAKYIHNYPEVNFRIDFLATGGRKGFYDDEILKTGSRIFYIKYSISTLFSFRKSFVKLLKTGKYDVIHDHQDFVSGWHYLAGLGYLPRKRISHLHNPFDFVRNYITGFSRQISFRFGRFLMVLFATQITGTSDKVMDEYGYNKWPFKRKRVLPAYCGFDVQRFKFNKEERLQVRNEFGWDDKTKIGLFIGRLGLRDHENGINQKNPCLALKIAKQLAIQRDWKFLFVGSKGQTGIRFENEIIRLGLDGYIKFVGEQKHVPGYMSAADYLLFPSINEGLGMVAIEAQANGLNVIASEALPAEAIISKTLIAQRNLADPVEDWCETIMKTMIDNHRDPGHNAKIEGSSFSIKNSVDRLIELYI